MSNEFVYWQKRSGLSLDEIAIQLDCSSRTVYRYANGETRVSKLVLSRIRELCLHREYDEMRMEPAFRFIDLFAGIGGIRRGFESVGGKCVFTSEWDRFSRETYLANFPTTEDHAFAGDITQVSEIDIPDHDVLLAGFPCQPFSIAGVSKKNSLGRATGFLDQTQGTLFFDVARIIAYHRPKAFLLENVKNLYSHDKGNTFRVIHKTLTEELGYQVHYRIIDGKHVVPQHRERIYIVGFRDANDFDFQSLHINNELGKTRLGDILHPQDGSEQPEEPFTYGPLATVAEKYTLTNHLWEYLQQYAAKHRAKGNGFGYGLVGPEDITRTLSARYHKDGSEILIAQTNKNPRRLTPRECARLMGFDEMDTSTFRIPVSDTQAYRQFGNSVVVPVIKLIAQHMLPYIKVSHEVEHATINFLD
jgi:DNA (cytosine-5)-methyltransferase 1